MPQSVCIDCRILFEHSYRFKQMCKKGETLLRQVPLTGDWPDELMKPKLPPAFTTKPKQELNTIMDVPILFADLDPKPTIKREYPQKLGNVTIKRTSQVAKDKDQNSAESTSNLPKKILNANPAKSPEPPVPKRPRKELNEVKDDPTTIFLNKVENDEKLSIDDLHRFIEANTVEDVTREFQEKKRPKVLNKSSVRILNKEANKVIEPQFSKPEIKRDKDGNVAIVTELIDPSEFLNESDRNIKDAAPVETNVFPCPNCERTFPLRQLRDIHAVNHTRERSNPCKLCVKSFFSKYDLQTHMLTHSGDKPFKCSICTKAFTRSNLLHRHEKTHTDVPKYLCLHCEKPFISQKEMEKHAERHTKKRPYQCSVCSKSFAFKQGLERHFVIHSVDQPFPCQYCDQTFLTASKLARHLTAHAGRRPYPCRFCPKSFLLSHHLTRHLRNHKSSASNYECHSCQSVFTAREDLIRHSAEHTKLSLVCVLCREQLPSEDKVEEHILAHVSNDAYGCEFCEMIFLSDDALQKHASEDHADDMIAYIEDEKKQQKSKDKKPQTGKDDEKVSPKRKRGEEEVEEENEEDEEFLESIKEYFLDEDHVLVKNEPRGHEIEVMDAEDLIEELENENEEAEDDDMSIENESDVEQTTVKVEKEINASKKLRSSGRAENQQYNVKILKKEDEDSSPKKRPFVAAKTGGASGTGDKKLVEFKSEKSNAKEIIDTEGPTKRTSGRLIRNADNEMQDNKQPTHVNRGGPSTSKSARASSSPRESNGVAKKKVTKIITEDGISESVQILLDKETTNGKKRSVSKPISTPTSRQGRLRIKDGRILLSNRSTSPKDK